MELDVHLYREGAEQWGFRLIGGADYGMPLTVVKVLPNSPASEAGLLNGDTVRLIQDRDCSHMTHDDAREALGKAGRELLVGVSRGLYDPVLDDYDPIYESIDQEDFDQPSQATEVPFQIQNFTDDLNFDIKLPEYPDPAGLSISRSLTASPFVSSTKPYRPFSTEPIPPIEVPPLEDPIILNPNYHDNFNKHDNENEFLPETKFKLPISEQYDPDGTRKKRAESKVGERIESKEINIEGFRSVNLNDMYKKDTFVEEVKKEIQSQQIKECSIDEISKECALNEMKLLEQRKKVDLESIESTARSVVDNSIEKAVTVAQEIKNEIDIELRASMEKTDISESKKTKSSELDIEFKSAQEKVSEIKSSIKHTEISENVELKKASAIAVAKEVIDLIDKTSEEIVQNGRKKNVDVSKQVEMFENLKEKEKVIEKQVSSKQDVTTKFAQSRDQTNVVSHESESKTSAKTKSEISSQISTSKTENVENKSKMSTARLLQEQRPYIIGLQTIPQFRGSVNSSYHYNLLLKTFFIHLTDVMVALSRFILAEPVLDKEPNQEHVTQKSETIVTEKKSSDVTSKTSDLSSTEIATKLVEDKMESLKVTNDKVSERTSNLETLSDVKERVVQETLVTASKQEKHLDEEVSSIIDHRKLSGSKMAQLTERKSAELTDRMDAVISEFQTKAGIEEVATFTEDIKSVSTATESRAMESELLQEKVSTSSTVNTSKIASSSVTQSHQEKKESKRKQREDLPTYVAIVQSHVYTNQDTILEDHQFSGLTSETGSLQSPNETQTAVDISEAFDTAQATKTIQIKQESSILEDTKQVALKQLSEKVTSSKSKEVVDTEKIFREVENKTKLSQTSQAVATSEKTEQSYVQKEALQASTIQIKEESAKLEDSKQIAVEQLSETQTTSKSKEVVDTEKIFKEVENKTMFTETSQAVATTKNIEQSFVPKVTPEVRTKLAIDHLKEVATVKVTEPEIKETVKSFKITNEFDATTKNENLSVSTEIVEGSHTKKTTQTELKTKTEEVEILHKESKIQQESISTAVSQVKSIEHTVQDESAALKVTKEQITEISEDMSLKEECETLEEKQIESKADTMYEAVVSTVEQRTFDTAESQIQESSFIAKSVETNHYDASLLKLDLKTNYPLEKQSSSTSSVPSEISTPTPSRVPPTPLTDEYIFKLEIPLPRSRGGTPYPYDPTLEPTPEPLEEDPNIVKKKLVPHIETTIESKIFDPPLPSPPEDKISPPVYTKPGLRGGADKRQYRKEEIREIERKSSLLASAIDETIRNIEQYNQQVANEAQQELNSSKAIKDTATMFNGFAKLLESKVVENGVTNSDTYNTKVYKSPTLINGTPKSNIADKKDAKSKTEVNEMNNDDLKEEPIDLKGYRTVEFNPDDIVPMPHVVLPVASPAPVEVNMYKTEAGEVIGSQQGIVDGLEKPIVEDHEANLGKPGLTDDKIAELMSGESEMLREAHVMGLSRVLKSHMHRATDDDSSVDFKKIKPIIDSLKDSEVLKALNDELVKTKEEKKKEERKWTTFMQKPSRPVPRAKFGYPGWTAQEGTVQEQYKVKIVKQPKPKVAPDYKPEDFETGPLPWEERALNEPPPPPVEPEDPILIPEELPEFLEAVDPLPESEVPDLEDTGIPLPPPQEQPEETSETPEDHLEEVAKEPKEEDIETAAEETEVIEEDMEQKRIADDLMNNVQNMVDPNAPLDQQLKQMQAQIAALAQLPCVIQQTLDIVTKQLSQMTTSSMESQRVETVEAKMESEVVDESSVGIVEEVDEPTEKNIESAVEETEQVTITENGTEVQDTPKETRKNLTDEEMARLKEEEKEMLDEQQRIEKQKKELMDQMKVELNGRQIKQRPTPRVGKPAPMFGPLTPQERPVVLPGGRRWRKPQDAYNEQFIAETLSANAEVIRGKAIGLPYESVRLPYDDRINFMKYEKPPVSLDHLQTSEVYKLVHNMDKVPQRRVDMLTPVMAEADYREKCRSMTPSTMDQCINIP